MVVLAYLGYVVKPTLFVYLQKPGGLGGRDIPPGFAYLPHEHYQTPLIFPLCTILWNNSLVKGIISNGVSAGWSCRARISLSLFRGRRCVHEEAGTTSASGMRRAVHDGMFPAKRQAETPG